MDEQEKTNEEKTSQNQMDRIQDVFDEKEIADLKYFLYRKDFLNLLNFRLLYLFHLIQSSGIIISSYATSKNDTQLFWVGMSLNMLASLIHVYENINNETIKQYENEINEIKNGKYDHILPKKSLIEIFPKEEIIKITNDEHV
jgi:hypothetical protein